MSSQKIGIILGLFCLLLGFLWPWISKLPLSRLPGDIYLDRPWGKFYFPVTTMILIGLFLSAVFRFLNK